MENSEQDQELLVDKAILGDELAFQRISDRHRKEIQLHCYRMLGSFHHAEDLTNEVFLRAWRGLSGFERRGSFRNWLYKIATNVCLSAHAKRAREGRVLPDARFPPGKEMPFGNPTTDVAWLEPYPDAELDGVIDSSPGPDVRYEMRESIQLAFIASIQLLPPRQRAALLLQDVLGWSAGEAAQLLDVSVASVNSALQRARSTLRKRLPAGRQGQPKEPTEAEREILDRYVKAWESADVDGFAALLREDSVMMMPPWPQWFQGRDDIAAFFAWTQKLGARGRFHLLKTASNCQPAFAFYSRSDPNASWKPHSIQLLELQHGRISVCVSCVLTDLFPVFQLPYQFPYVT